MNSFPACAERAVAPILLSRDNSSIGWKSSGDSGNVATPRERLWFVTA